MATIRIDKLIPDTEVTLRFTHGDEWAKFVSVTGAGDERTASFLSHDFDDELYKWSAYRFKGHWTYGTSAEYLRLVSVDKLPLREVIEKILVDAYGSGSLLPLALKIIMAQELWNNEKNLTDTLWMTYSGGGTAARTAHKIIEAAKDYS